MCKRLFFLFIKQSLCLGAWWPEGRSSSLVSQFCHHAIAIRLLPWRIVISSLMKNISSAHYRRTWQFLKAEDFQINSVILTGKYNKGRLHVARQYCMLWKTRGHEKNPQQTAAIHSSVPKLCFLWRQLRCVWLEAALLDQSVCVIKVLREL